MQASADPPGQSEGTGKVGGDAMATIDPDVAYVSGLSVSLIRSFNQHSLPALGIQVQPTQPVVCWQASQHSDSLPACNGASPMLLPSLFMPGEQRHPFAAPH